MESRIIAALLRQVDELKAKNVQLLGSTGNTKRVYFVRHGQGHHNVLWEAGQETAACELRDPGLTSLGWEQAEAVARDPLLQKALFGDETEQAQLVVVSPLRRTTETAIGAFDRWLQSQPTTTRPAVVLQSGLQETANVLCDTGSRIPRLKSWLDSSTESYLDFSTLSPTWYVKDGINDEANLKERLGLFEQWLAERSEEVVIIVAHHNVFLGLLGVTFKNCEVREYAFQSDAPGGSIFSKAPKWTALSPTISACDSELSEADQKHLANYESHCRENLVKWGLPVPERLR
jgi:broad specificity phosphatase PhoE